MKPGTEHNPRMTIQTSSMVQIRTHHSDQHRITLDLAKSNRQMGLMCFFFMCLQEICFQAGSATQKNVLTSLCNIKDFFILSSVMKRKKEKNTQSCLFIYRGVDFMTESFTYLDTF